MHLSSHLLQCRWARKGSPGCLVRVSIVVIRPACGATCARCLGPILPHGSLVGVPQELAIVDVATLNGFADSRCLYTAFKAEGSSSSLLYTLYRALRTIAMILILSDLDC